MIASQRSELGESNRQFIDFASLYARLFPGGEVVEPPGWVAAWANTAVLFCNAVLLAGPVEDREDLERRAEALKEYLKPKRKPPLVLLCREWVPEALREAASELLRGAGLEWIITIKGMAAEELSPPQRAVTGVEFRRVTDAETRNQFADINGAANHMPVAEMREALAAPEIWTDDFAGYVAYCEGQAAAAASAMELNGSLHVTCVATLPEFQKRGLGEAVMRRALEDRARATGIRRTTLHATPAGFPVYRRMGYHETATFEGYARAADGGA